MAAPQPGPEPFATDAPGFPVAIDQEIDKSGARGCMKEPAETALETSISADIAARAADRVGVQSQTGLLSLHDLIGRQSPLLHACLLPKPAGKLHGIDAGGLPPGAFVACAMRGPVMHAAEWDREFIARFAAQRAWLHIAQMMRIGWLAAAHEACLYDGSPRGP